MEKINKLFDEMKDVDEYYEKYKTQKSEIARLEAEISKLQGELRLIDTENLRNEIRTVEEEYQKSFIDIDTFALNALECHKTSDLKMVLSRVKDTEVVKAKSLDFLRSLFYVTGIDRGTAGTIAGLDDDTGMSEMFVVFVIDKGILPDEMRLYHDDASLCFIFQAQDAEDVIDGFHKKNVRLLGMEKLSEYKIVSHVIFKILRENLRTGVIRRGLSNERIEENNVFFDKSDFYIHNVTEWKVDAVMKEIIDMTRKVKDTRIEEVLDGSDKMPLNVSVDYKR